MQHAMPVSEAQCGSSTPRSASCREGCWLQDRSVDRSTPPGHPPPETLAARVYHPAAVCKRRSSSIGPNSRRNESQPCRPHNSAAECRPQPRISSTVASKDKRSRISRLFEFFDLATHERGTIFSRRCDDTRACGDPPVFAAHAVGRKAVWLASVRGVRPSPVPLSTRAIHGWTALA